MIFHATRHVPMRYPIRIIAALGLIFFLAGCLKSPTKILPHSRYIKPSAIRGELVCPNVSNLNLNQKFDFDDDEFQDIFSGIDSKTPEKIIQFLSKNPGIARLFSKQARVAEGYSLEEHTRRVMSQFISQRVFFIDKYKKFKYATDYEKLMLTFLALHEIGKPCSPLNSKKNHFTYPIVEKVFNALGFSTKDRRIAVALAKGDPISDYIQENRPSERADFHGTQYHADTVRILSRETPLKPDEFYEISQTYYIAELSATPGQEKQAFDTSPLGELTFRTSRRENLNYPELLKNLRAQISDKSKAEILLSKLGPGFIPISEDPAFAAFEKNQIPTEIDTEPKYLIPSIIEDEHSYRFAYDEFYHHPVLYKFDGQKNYRIPATPNWEKAPFVKRVIGYTFRGDPRSPSFNGPKENGGFWPSSVHFGWNDQSQDSFNGSNTHYPIQNPKRTSFVSTTKSVRIAKNDADNGFVYVTLVEGGFEIPGRQEVAVLGGIPWEDVMAYRQVANGKFVGDLYVREKFQEFDPDAYKQIVASLNGRDLLDKDFQGIPTPTQTRILQKTLENIVQSKTLLQTNTQFLSFENWMARPSQKNITYSDTVKLYQNFCYIALDQIKKEGAYWSPQSEYRKLVIQAQVAQSDVSKINKILFKANNKFQPPLFVEKPDYSVVLAVLDYIPNACTSLLKQNFFEYLNHLYKIETTPEVIQVKTIEFFNNEFQLLPEDAKVLKILNEEILNYLQTNTLFGVPFQISYESLGTYSPSIELSSTKNLLARILLRFPVSKQIQNSLRNQPLSVSLEKYSISIEKQ